MIKFPFWVIEIEGITYPLKKKQKKNFFLLKKYFFFVLNILLITIS